MSSEKSVLPEFKHLI